MKKCRIFSLTISAFLATQMCSSLKLYSLYLGEPLEPPSDTELLYTSNDCIVLHPYDIIKVINKRETYLTFSSVDRGCIYEFDAVPSDEEAKEIMGPVASAFGLINADPPYMMNYSITQDGVVTKKKTYYPANIKYVLDMTDVDKKELRDFDSDELLYSFTDNHFYYVGPYGTDPAKYKTVWVLDGILVTPMGSTTTHDSLFNSDQNTKPQSIEYGDINADSEIDLSDLTILSLHLLGDKNLTEEKLKYADCNGDGTVNLADLAHFKQYISKDNVTLGPVS